MAHLTDTLYTRAPVSPNCHTLPFTGSLQTSNLPQQSSVKLSDAAHTGSVTSSKTVPQAGSKQVLGASSCLLCELEVWALSLPRFLLAAAVELSAVPSGPHTAAWRRCECNLLFSCRWLELGLWLLSLRLWRDEKLDLLGADGDFIWLKPPFEMFQGAATEQKAGMARSDLAD